MFCVCSSCCVIVKRYWYNDVLQSTKATLYRRLSLMACSHTRTRTSTPGTEIRPKMVMVAIWDWDPSLDPSPNPCNVKCIHRTTAAIGYSLQIRVRIRVCQ